MNTKNQTNATSVITYRESESVETLFGLTPNQIYFSLGRFFDYPRMCSIALMEMLEAIQKGNDSDDDISCLIILTKTMRILVDLERLCPLVSPFLAVFNSSNNDPKWLSKISKNDTEEMEYVTNLHNSLLSIVDSVDKIGFITFSYDVALSIGEVTTKTAYEDMVSALSCIHTIYIAYIKSKYRVQSSKKMMNNSSLSN
jgi:hypothetical protein